MCRLVYVAPQSTWDSLGLTALGESLNAPADEIGVIMHKFVTVLIENSYECGFEETHTVQVEAPSPEDYNLIDFWEKVHDLTGTGHDCGEREDALYEVRITEAGGRSYLVGLSMGWQG